MYQIGHDGTIHGKKKRGRIFYGQSTNVCRFRPLVDRRGYLAAQFRIHSSYSRNRWGIVQPKHTNSNIVGYFHTGHLKAMFLPFARVPPFRQAEQMYTSFCFFVETKRFCVYSVDRRPGKRIVENRWRHYIEYCIFRSLLYLPDLDILVRNFQSEQKYSIQICQCQEPIFANISAIGSFFSVNCVGRVWKAGTTAGKEDGRLAHRHEAGTIRARRRADGLRTSPGRH